MANYAGQLNQNEIFSAIYNMIISQQAFGNPIGGLSTALVDEARVDGGLNGDTKLYYSTDALESHAWGNDSEAANLLAIKRPPAPACQAITLNIFRQIDLTVDNYLSKRAYADEGAYTQVMSVFMSWIKNTKKIYDNGIYNVFIGTNTGALTDEAQSITVASGANVAQVIAEGVANIIDELAEPTRLYNDNGFIRAYELGDLEIVWNKKFMNKLVYESLPVLYHNDAVKEQLLGKKMNARYFGATTTSSDIDSTSKKAATGKVIRAKKEMTVGTGSSAKHYFPGDKFDANTTFGTSQDVALADAYTEDSTIICKIYGKGSVPYMSAFEVDSTFWNAKSLTENHYLTFGHNTLQHLKEYPFITVKKA